MSTKHDEAVLRIKAANENGVTLTHISRASGVSQFRINAWKTGKEYTADKGSRVLNIRPFDDDEAGRIIAALDVVKSAI